MKNQDRILFALPVCAGALVLFFAVLLLWQLNRFEHSYRQEARAEVELKGRLAADLLRPLLLTGNLAEAQAYCNSFRSETTRLSLLEAGGKVLADSAEAAAGLGNHLDRPEIQSALAGDSGGTVRYSTSLNAWMFYHAVRLTTPDGDYILRVSITADRISRMLQWAESNILLALLLGGALVMLLTFYIAARVRRPMRELQQSAAALADGKLDTRIVIPPAGVVHGLAREISRMAEQLKQRLAEASRERNEKEAILNAVAEAILLVKANGEASRFNRAAAALFQIPPEQDAFQLSRAGIPELLPLIRQTFRTGETFAREFDCAPTGGRRTLWIQGGRLEQEKTSYVWLAASDLTELRKLESFRSDFIANVSHEIMTPLTCIIGAAEALQEPETTQGGQAGKFLTMLADQARRLNLLVQDILSLAALERRRLNPEKEFAPVRLDAVLQNAVHSCAERAEEQHSRLLVKENRELEIQGDSQLLEQAVINLVSNALKYSGSPTIELSCRRQGADAVLEIRDFGIGIAPEHQARIFERFYRVHKERSRRLGGTGLGLAIVKHVAQLHNGYARVESAPGQGAAFSIVLPLQP